MGTLKKILTLGVLFVLAACDVRVSNRSGTLQDDYIEEPLSVMAREFAPALETSNAIIELLIRGETETVHGKYFAPSLKQRIDQKMFAELFGKVVSVEGSLKTFKPMQWGFFSGKDQSENFLYSVKIAEHEKRMVKYLFVFDRDGRFSEIVGFHLKPRDGVSPPGVF